MLQPTTNNKIYTAALYCRLSKDDGFADRDSSSIETQREMLCRMSLVLSTSKADHDKSPADGETPPAGFDLDTLNLRFS